MNRSSSPSGAPTTTGRYLVLLRQDGLEEGIRDLQNKAGAKSVVKMSEIAHLADMTEQLHKSDAIVFENLGVAVVNLDRDRISTLNIAHESSPIQAIAPERIVRALHINGKKVNGRVARAAKKQALSERSAPSLEYLRGYRDAINGLVNPFLPPGETSPAADALSGVRAATFDETRATWGLQITKVVETSFTGKGIKVAILDTGLDLKHPDFANRNITHRSFVPHVPVEDVVGHGTHCSGTACGSFGGAIPLPRYGIAYEAEIFIGKVLNNEGSGNDMQILAGIEWAITQGCQVVSMSFGAPVAVGESFSLPFETAAQRALQKGTLLIAAAGNESHRDSGQSPAPVDHPANCPSVMAVGALDQDLRVAFFSNGSVNEDGGRVDIAAPGLDVFSTWPMPQRYNTISGTSMATPHVAGVAALYAQAFGLSGGDLWNMLIRNALPLSNSASDVGTGLVQAPLRLDPQRLMLDISDLVPLEAD